MSKIYNVGDTVKIKSDLQLVPPSSEHPGTTNQMLIHRGATAIITRINNVGRETPDYRLDIDGSLFNWNNHFFEEHSKIKVPSNIDRVTPSNVKVGQYVKHRNFPLANDRFVFKVIDITSTSLETEVIYSISRSTSTIKGELNTFTIDRITERYNDVRLISEDEDELLLELYGVTNYPDNYKDKEIKLPIPNFFKDSKYLVKKVIYDTDFRRETSICFILSERPKMQAVTFENGKSKTIKFKYLSDIRELTQSELKDTLISWSKPKIKSIENSISLFGHKTRKTAMFDQSNNTDPKLRKDFKLTNIIYNYEKDGKYYHVVELFDGTLNLKFLLDDIDLRLPNVNNYTLPMDRTIEIGTQCKVIKDKLLPVRKDSTIKVMKIFNRHKPVMGKRYDKNSIAVVTDNTGKTFQCKIKQLKKIAECKKQETELELPF